MLRNPAYKGQACFGLPGSSTSMASEIATSRPNSTQTPDPSHNPIEAKRRTHRTSRLMAAVPILDMAKKMTRVEIEAGQNGDGTVTNVLMIRTSSLHSSTGARMTALQLYLAWRAQGLEMEAPGVRR